MFVTLSYQIKHYQGLLYGMQLEITEKLAMGGNTFNFY